MIIVMNYDLILISLLSLKCFIYSYRRIIIKILIKIGFILQVSYNKVIFSLAFLCLMMNLLDFWFLKCVIIILYQFIQIILDNLNSNYCFIDYQDFITIYFMHIFFFFIFISNTLLIFYSTFIFLFT